MLSITKRLFSKQWVRISLLIVAVWVVYANSFKVPFIWDDEEMVVGNTLIQDVSNLKSIFSSGAFGGAFSSNAFYRPIQIASFILDYHFWGLNTNGYHAVNILIHTLSTICLYLLINQLGFAGIVAWLAALFWGIHPTHIECVTYISGRGDVMYLLFCMISALFFVQSEKKSQLHFIGALFFFILAMLTKENSIVLPFLMGLVVIFYPQENHGKLSYIKVSLLSFIAIFYSLFRVLPSSDTTTLSWIASASLWERIATLPYMLWTYIKLLVFPYPLHMEYHYVAPSLFNIYTLLALPFLCGIFYMAYKYLPQQRLLLFAVSWFLIGLGPVYNILLPLASTVREHWQYLPSIGLFIWISSVVVWAFDRYHRLRPPIVISCLTIFVVFSCVTISRNWDWQDAFRLYSHDVKHEPRSFLLHNNLGVIYFRERNDIPNAQKAFLKAVKTSPYAHYAVAHSNLGVMYELQGYTELAKEEYQQGIMLGAYRLAYVNLAKIYVNEGKITLANQLLKEASQRYPNDLSIQSMIVKLRNYKNKE